MSDAFDFGGVEGIELPAALALLLGADLLGARQRPLECGLQLGLSGDLATDVADEAAENGVFVEAQLGGHILARQAVCTPQNDAASLR